MKKLLMWIALILATLPAAAQIPNPQIALAGTFGSGSSGTPFQPAGTLAFTSDADHAMVYPEMTANVIKVTSNVALTATRNLIAPQTIGYMFEVENETSGGQSIVVEGSSGTGVTIPNGQSASVYSDGTNYNQSAPNGSSYFPGSATVTVSGAPSTSQLALISTGTGSSNWQAQTLTNTSTISSLPIPAAPVQEYMNTPQPALANWLQALDNCQNQVVHLAFLWDSYGVAYQAWGGAGPSNPNNRPPDLWRTYLAARCGLHGTGLVPLIGYLLAGSPNPNPQYYTNSSGPFLEADIGPAFTSGSTTLGQIARYFAGNTVTFTTNGIATDTINTYCVQGPSYGTWNISIDGGAETGTCGGNASVLTAQMVSISAGSLSTTHSTTLTCSASPCEIYGMQGTGGTTGAEVDNVSAGSGVAELYTSPTAFAFLDLIPGGLNGVISKWQTNEPIYSTPTATYAASLQAIVTHEQATASNPGILIFTAPVSSGCNNPSTMPSYSAAALGMAQTNNVAFLNILDAWGSTYVPSLFGSDGCHPTDKGTLSEFALTKRAMVDTEPTPPSSANFAQLVGGNSFTGNQLINGYVEAQFWEPGAGTPTGACGPIGTFLPSSAGQLVQCLSTGWTVIGINSGTASHLSAYAGNGSVIGQTNLTVSGNDLTVPGIVNFTELFGNYWEPNSGSPSGSCGPIGTLLPSSSGQLMQCLATGWTNIGYGAAGITNSGTQYQVPFYTATGTTLGGSNITTDSGHNNLTIPGFLTTQYIEPMSGSTTAPVGACGPNGTVFPTSDSNLSICSGGTWTKLLIGTGNLALLNANNTFTGTNNFSGAVNVGGSPVCTTATGCGVSGITALTGDVTASGSGSVSSTVVGVHATSGTLDGVTIGNTTPSPSVTSAYYLGPATAPTGSCSPNGAFVPSRDGVYSSCILGIWVNQALEGTTTCSSGSCWRTSSDGTVEEWGNSLTTAGGDSVSYVVITLPFTLSSITNVSFTATCNNPDNPTSVYCLAQGGVINTTTANISVVSVVANGGAGGDTGVGTRVDWHVIEHP